MFKQISGVASGHHKWAASYGIIYPICSMVLVYLPTKLADFWQMLGFIFQHHGSHLGFEVIMVECSKILPGIKAEKH